MKIMNVLLAVLILGFSSFAHAENLVELGNVEIVINPGTGLTAVEPTASIQFTFSSCDRRNFKVVTEKNDGIVYITVSDEGAEDCATGSTEREYSMQVSSDASFEKYVLNNPIAASLKN